MAPLFVEIAASTRIALPASAVRLLPAVAKVTGSVNVMSPSDCSMTLPATATSAAGDMATDAGVSPNWSPAVAGSLPMLAMSMKSGSSNKVPTRPRVAPRSTRESNSRPCFPETSAKPP